MFCPSEPPVPRPLCSPYGFLHPFVQARWLQSSTWLCCFSFVCISSHHLRNLWFLGRVARHMSSRIRPCKHDVCALPHGSAYSRKKAEAYASPCLSATSDKHPCYLFLSDHFAVFNLFCSLCTMSGWLVPATDASVITHSLMLSSDGI